jgi:hypothetical protein
MDTFHIVNLHAIFAENAHCLAQRLGVDIIKDFSPEKGHTYILFGSHDHAPTLYTCQVSLAKEGKDFKFIIINGEPPQSPHLRNKYYIELMRNNIVWDYHAISSVFLKSLGIRVYSIYCFEFIHTPVTTKREIDILFIGSRNERREKLFNNLVKRYPNKKIVFEMDWKHSNHNDLRALLQSAKIVLNIPYYESGILETHRINSALANDCVVISLYSGHKQTDDFYSPYVYFTHDFFELLDSWTEPILPKLGYINLVKAISPTIQHNQFIIKQLQKN